MSLFKRKALAQIVRPMVVIAGITVALLVSQSCSDKSSDDNNRGDTIKSWPEARQDEIDVSPAWSPDGSKIIYFRFFNHNAVQFDTQWTWGVFLHDVESGTDSLLWENFKAIDFDWSPDGSLLAYSMDGRIYISNLAGDTLRYISNSERAWVPRWSPCGDKITFCTRVGNNRGMYLFDPALGNQRLVLRYVTDADWMSNCDTIVAISFEETDFGSLVVHTLGDGHTWDLPYIENLKRYISSSPDGRDILIARDGGANMVNIWRLNIVTGSYTELTTEGGNYPEWSPDGQWIVYTKVDKDNGHLWLMRPDGSEKHQITF